jgi:hypothetical protein
MGRFRFQTMQLHLELSINLIVVYGPCRQPARDLFVNWLYNLEIDDDELLLLIGDFNFYRYAENRNRPGVTSMIL